MNSFVFDYKDLLLKTSLVIILDIITIFIYYNIIDNKSCFVYYKKVTPYNTTSKFCNYIIFYVID